MIEVKNHKEIFEYLFEISKNSKDPRGVVSACLVDHGKIIIAKASADDGVYHAEDLLIRDIIEKNIKFSPEAILYTTLQPCPKRSNPLMIDCTSQIINIGIKNVIFGAKDPEYFEQTEKRLTEAGVNLYQIDDPEIIRRCALVFNESVQEEQKGIKMKPLS